MNEILKKRIEEASYEDADGLYPRYFAHHAVRMSGFLAGAEYALHNQWINIKEALPDNQSYVLAKYKSSIFVAWYRKRNNMWHNIYGIEMDVDRWMPIPKLKKNNNE